MEIKGLNCSKNIEGRIQGRKSSFFIFYASIQFHMLPYEFTLKNSLSVFYQCQITSERVKIIAVKRIRATYKLFFIGQIFNPNPNFFSEKYLNVVGKKICTKNPTTDPVVGFPDLIAKVRYVDFQKRSHTVEVQIAIRYKRIEHLSDHLQNNFTNKNAII